MNAPGTRADGWARLLNFLPRVGAYARERNFVRPGHPAVSGLSPYLSRRLLTEAEVWEQVRARWSYTAAEKFLQEVAWRTYWKGWLQMRPSVWKDYLAAVTQARAQCLEQNELAARVAAAEQGRTGLACFDHWVGELRSTGYLHNHVRMWVASIWIFTLELPWALGADFFYRQLLDADAASNTLSWRWVAGWQTPGKHYLARAENIARYTEGKFHPVGQLREHAPPLPMTSPLPPPDPSLIPAPQAFTRGERTGLLLHGEDSTPERFFRGKDGPLPWVVAAAPPLPSAPGAPGADQPVAWAFSKQAHADSIARWTAVTGVPVVRLEESAAQPGDWIQAAQTWAKEERLATLCTPLAPVGWWAEQLHRLQNTLREAGVEVRFLVSDWDATLWPQATRGFFPFREKLRPLVEKVLVDVPT